MRYFLLLVLLLAANSLRAQNTSLISGYVRTSNYEALENVTVRIAGSAIVTQTDKTGFYQLAVPSSKVIIRYSRIGYKTLTLNLGLLVNQRNSQDVELYPDLKSLDEVQVSGNATDGINSKTISAATQQALPTVSGNFESILKTLPGVSSNNELSSQYSVRGGNFDENLLYVNDIEIYRPLLIRNGQQEGLSFINPELAGRVRFSAGGFEARYGDKLSSVLDVKYLKPDSITANVSLGLMGNSATVKLPFRNSFIISGIRLKTNQNLLNKQDTRGNYRPDFADYQFLYNRELNEKISLAFFGNYNRSLFTLEPQSRETTFGTFDEVLRLQVDYTGKEADRYETFMGALTFLFKPSPLLNFKWISSAFKSIEQERFDIEGRYIFDEIEPGLGSTAFGKVRANRGFGSNLDFARNSLKATIYSTELKAFRQFSRSFFESGVKLEHNQIHDQLNEYSVIDSAGYTLPLNQNLTFPGFINSDNTIRTNKLSAYAQSRFDLSEKMTFSAGIRGAYHSVTKQFLFSPRVALAYIPSNEKDLVLRFSAGSYNQQPFYREFRNLNGSLNQDVRAQQSYHFVSAADYTFNGFGTRLKLSSELYYKWLQNITPYKIENLRIRYYADQQAKGYAAGADFSLSGEFVEGLESSFRLSLMKTEENIKGDFYSQKGSSTGISEAGYLKRPSDQRINFSVFFQDKLLKSPTYKVHLIMLYGSELPVGPPGTPRYRDVFKIPAYKRVDIGFSKDFLDSQSRKKPVFLQKYFNSVILYAEIFNMLNINNTVSYFWIKDVNNNQYAIPNYLTSRQFNFKLIARFRNY